MMHIAIPRNTDELKPDADTRMPATPGPNINPSDCTRMIRTDILPESSSEKTALN